MKRAKIALFLGSVVVWYSVDYLYALTERITKSEKTLELRRLIGLKDPLVEHSIAHLRQDIALMPDRVFMNRLIIWGPSGNGKSSLAKDIARASNCDLMYLCGASIVGRLPGQGAQTIVTVFEDAISRSAKTGRPVVIVIDGVEALVNTQGQTEYAQEYQCALQALLDRLDRHEHDPRLYIICITPDRTILSAPLVSRFGDNFVERANPDVQTREALLRDYAQSYNLIIADKEIKDIVLLSDTLSIRSLEGFVKSALVCQKIKQGALTYDELLALLTRMKDLVNANSLPKNEHDAGSYLRKISLATSIVHNTVSVFKIFYDLYTGRSPR